MPHRSFRPTDFAWRDLPRILIGSSAAPVTLALRGAGFWPEPDAADGTAGRRRKRLWRFALVLWLLLPFACLIASGFSVYAVGRGWATRSTATIVSWPSYSVIERTPLKSRWQFVLSNLLNRGLADGHRRISDIR